MAAEISRPPAARYGIAQVCRIWEVSRSSFYASRHRAADTTAPVPAQRRGPKPAISDNALLAAIRADLARSPWHGEGHRKVWARLRVMDGIRVARKRVLRLMRENALLSPHRARTRDTTPHDRHIITEGVCPETGGITPPLPIAGLGWRPAQRGGRTPNRARRCRPHSEPGAEDRRLVATIASAAICSFAD